MSVSFLIITHPSAGGTAYPIEFNNTKCPVKSGVGDAISLYTSS